MHVKEYANEMQLLNELGYSQSYAETEMLMALRRENGNLERAIDLLLATAAEEGSFAGSSGSGQGSERNQQMMGIEVSGGFLGDDACEAIASSEQPADCNYAHDLATLPTGFMPSLKMFTGRK
eukprot:1752391-Rhodomonas_salina.1